MYKTTVGLDYGHLQLQASLAYMTTPHQLLLAGEALL